MAKYKDITPFIRNLTAMKERYDAISLDGMIKALNDAPAADVVEVVRCKDCKYWKEEKDFGMFCTHWGSTLTESQAEDFCSYGERREGE